MSKQTPQKQRKKMRPEKPTLFDHLVLEAPSLRSSTAANVSIVRPNDKYEMARQPTAQAWPSTHGQSQQRAAAAAAPSVLSSGARVQQPWWSQERERQQLAQTTPNQPATLLPTPQRQPVQRSKQQQKQLQTPVKAAPRAATPAKTGIRRDIGRAANKRKNLTTLKKRLLLDRARLWQELMGSLPDAETLAAARSGAVMDTLITSEHTQPADSTTAEPDCSCAVFVSGLVSAEELEDDDEYAEIHSDVHDLASQYGPVSTLDIPRCGTAGCGTVTVTYSDAATAQRAVTGLQGRVIAGSVITASLTAAELHSSSDSSDPQQQQQQHSGGDSVQICISNLVQPDELCDDEEYEEIIENIAAMTAQYGAVRTVHIPRAEEDASLGLAYVTFHSAASAAPAVTGLNGKVVAGQTIASISSSSSSSSSTAAATSSNLSTCVEVLNMVTADDAAAMAQDDDEYSEACSDIMSIASVHGTVVSLSVPRNSSSAVSIVYATEAEAAAAADAISTLVLSGVQLQATVVSDTAASKQSTNAATDAHSSTTVTTAAAAQPAAAAAAVPVARSGKASPEQRERLLKALARAVQQRATAAHSAVVADKYKAAAQLPKLLPADIGSSDTVQQRHCVNQLPTPELDALVVEMLSNLFRFQERLRLTSPAKAKAKRRLVMGIREVLRGLRAGNVKMVIAAPNIDTAAVTGATAAADAVTTSGDTAAATDVAALDGSAVAAAAVTDVVHTNPLDDTVAEILAAAAEREVPVVFALSKRRLGRALQKQIKVSIVGIYSFEGAFDERKKIDALLKQLAAQS
jgi:ribosomal protein L7Ae-like RNA K-turn-binding protein